MKKIACFPLISLLLVFLASCTLDMDEWVASDEDKGYEEPVTVENDYYTLTYKYKPTTRSLTDTIQSFIAQVEADSIIYFLDNTPEEWLPKAGGQVVANCCKMFPMGYMGRVLSVEKTGGLIKVVTTLADLEDVYDDFNLDFDTDIFSSKPENLEKDSVNAARMQQRFTRATDNGGQQTNIVDWAMFNAMTDGKKQTRTDSDGKKDDDGEEWGDNKNEVRDSLVEVSCFGFSMDDELGEKLKEQVGWINTFSFNVISVSKTHMHKIVELQRKREYTETTTFTGYRFSLVLGKNFTKDAIEKWRKGEDHSLNKKVNELAKTLETKRPFNRPINTKEGDNFLNDGITMDIPIGGIPFGIVIRVKPIIDFDLNICGNFEILYWQSGSKTVTDVIDEKKEYDKTTPIKDKKQFPKNEFSINVFGNLHASLGIEVFVGLGRVMAKKALGIGVYVNANGSFDINLDKTIVGPYWLGSNDEFLKMTANLSIGAKILTGGFFWSPGDVHLAELEKWSYGPTLFYHPQIDKITTYPMLEKEVNGEKHLVQRISYRFNQFGLEPEDYLIFFCEPVLYVYTKKDDPEHVAVIINEGQYYSVNDKRSGTNTDAKLEAILFPDEAEYNFYLINDEQKDYYVAPGLLTKSDFYSSEVFLQYLTKLPVLKVPTIEYVIDDTYENTGSTYIYQGTSYQSADGRFHYVVDLPFELHEGSLIKRDWKDWGVYYEIYCAGDKKHRSFQYTGKKSLKNKINKSGKYVLKGHFSANYNSNELPILVKTYLWVENKEGVRYNIGSADAYMYSHYNYKFNGKDNGEILLKNREQLDMLSGLGPNDDINNWKERGYDDVRFEMSQGEGSIED